MSRKTMSGRTRLIAATASRPVDASPTISTSGAAPSMRRTFARAGASSSTMSARTFGLVGGRHARGHGARGERKRHAEAPSLRNGLEVGTVTVEKSQPIARRAESSAESRWSARRGVDVVLDDDAKVAAAESRRYRDVRLSELERRP